MYPHNIISHAIIMYVTVTTYDISACTTSYPPVHFIPCVHATLQLEGWAKVHGQFDPSSNATPRSWIL